MYFGVLGHGNDVYWCKCVWLLQVCVLVAKLAVEIRIGN